MVYLDYVPDIEELKICEQDNCKKDCPGCPNRQNSFFIDYDNAKWVKVYTYADLLSILRGAKTSNYMLVGGNTAKGQYVIFTLTLCVCLV